MTALWPTDRREQVLEPFYHAIGVTACRWARAEEEFKELAIQCSEIRNEAARDAIFTHMQNVSLADALRTVANESYEPDLSYFKGHLLWACQMFDSCRENRNLVSHLNLSPVGYSDRTAADAASLFRKTAKGEIKTKSQLIFVADIREIADEIAILCKYLSDLQEAYHCYEPWPRGARPPLPDKPALPQRRTSTLQPFQLDSLRPPEASLA
jgi:hypothetical protein